MEKGFVKKYEDLWKNMILVRMLVKNFCSERFGGYILGLVVKFFFVFGFKG